MTYFKDPTISNERQVTRGGKTVLVADTTTIMDCTDPAFSRSARDRVERDQARVAKITAFDAVDLNQI